MAADEELRSGVTRYDAEQVSPAVSRGMRLLPTDTARVRFDAEQPVTVVRGDEHQTLMEHRRDQALLGVIRLIGDIARQAAFVRDGPFDATALRLDRHDRTGVGRDEQLSGTERRQQMADPIVMVLDRRARGRERPRPQPCSIRGVEARQRELKLRATTAVDQVRAAIMHDRRTFKSPRLLAVMRPFAGRDSPNESALAVGQVETDEIALQITRLRPAGAGDR